MIKLCVGLLAAALAVLPAAAQSGTADMKAILLKHLQTSEDFTVKVAEAMPEDNYSFKLTPEQMSFGEQMIHLGSALRSYTGALAGERPKMTKPNATSKADVIAFVKSSFETATAEIEKLSPEQLSASHKGGGGSTQTGYDIVLGMLNHTTNHRASAEMYLRVKGITPPQYQF